MNDTMKGSLEALEAFHEMLEKDSELAYKDYIHSQCEAEFLREPSPRELHGHPPKQIGTVRGSYRRPTLPRTGGDR